MPAFYNDTTPAAPAGSQNVKWQVDGSGNVSAYLPTAPLAAPSLNLLAQSAAISTTTFFATGTTPGAGMYRLSYYTYVTVAGNAVNLTATFTWQDDSGAAANTLTTGLAGAGPGQHAVGSRGRVRRWCATCNRKFSVANLASRACWVRG